MSRSIERDLLRLEQNPLFPSEAYGCQYESDRKYFLFTPQDDTFITPYVYNWITNSWTLWTRECSAAIVSDLTDKLYVGDFAGNTFEERKDFVNFDFADEHYDIVILSTDTTLNTLTLASSVNVIIGDVIIQTVGPDQFTTQVLGNDLVTGIVDVVDATGFAAGVAVDYRSIDTEIQYAPLHGGYAEYVKAWDSWQFMFSSANFSEITLEMSSDWLPAAETVMLSPVASGGWGTQAWGDFPWGVSTIPEQVISTWPTKNMRYAHWVIINLALTQAFTALALDGMSCTFDIVGTRSH